MPRTWRRFWNMDETKQPRNPQIGHETTDVNVWAVGKFAIGLVIVCVVSIVLLFGLLKFFQSPNSSTMDTTHTMTRPMANLPTAQTLTSVVSCPIWGLRGCLVSSMFQNLLQVRGIRRHQRALLQLREEVRQPQAHQADRNGEIQ